MTDYNIILASDSPRRKQLLEAMGVTFTVFTKPVPEDYPADLPATEVAEYLSRKKGEAYLPDLKPRDLIITADTTVVVGDLILNKPQDATDAQRMLQMLSGRSHQVITGVNLTTQYKTHSFSDLTTVVFRTLTDQEIDRYIQQYQPYDKAGGYAIQEWIGMVGIEKIEGSYFTVVGLPTHLLYEQLHKITA